MPYTYKKQGNKYVVYKKSNGKKVGTTAGTKAALDKYLAALHIHEPKKESKKPMKENYENKVGPLHVVLKPYPGCDVADMVHEIDPVMGATHKGIDAQTIHGVYGEQDEAMKCAEGLHKTHLDEMKKLEEKKGTVAKKLTSMIDKLESKRKDHMKLAKENPDHASEHKQHISQIQGQIEDLMDKLEKVAKSKKEEKTEEDEDGKKKVNENTEVSKYKVGDIVIPNKGPHKGQKHKVIHVSGDGKYNIKPIPRFPGDKNNYGLGAAGANEKDLDAQVDEASGPSGRLNDAELKVQKFLNNLSKHLGLPMEDIVLLVNRTIEKLGLK